MYTSIILLESPEAKNTYLGTEAHLSKTAGAENVYGYNFF